jgi:hypothetical protein
MSRRLALSIALGSLALLLQSGCGGSGSSGGGASVLKPITISLSSNSTTAPLNGGSPTLTVTVQRVAGDTNPVGLSVSPVPGGVAPQITSPGRGNTGTIAFSAAAAATPGTYALMVNATEGGPDVTAPLALTVLSAPVTVNVTVSPVVNTSVGFGGQMQTFMTTQIYAAEWDESFFPSLPQATETLASLNPQHIRVYAASQGIPQDGNGNWDFTVLDTTLDPVLGVGDKNISFVLTQGPPWMNDDNGFLLPEHFQDFAKLAAQMVQYFNTTTGFTDSNGVQHVHTPFTPITYWSILEGPDLEPLSPTQYAQVYDETVTAMQAAGSEIPLKFVAGELSGGTDPNDYFPQFLAAESAPIDVLSAQQYSVCGWFYTDDTVMQGVPYWFGTFAQHLAQIVATTPKLKNAVAWETENNVDADYNTSNGQGVCSDPFELDLRGTSPFFAGWRPYVFSQWAQAGSHMLSHSDFNQEPVLTRMYGEVTYDSDQPYISYWVDYYLQRYFPYCAPDEPPTCTAKGSSILTWSTSESSSNQTVEIFSTQNPDGSVVVMAADHAVNGPNDNNGPGAPRTVALDLSQLGQFTSATELTIDANTDIASGPAAVSVTPYAQMTLNMGGYGVTFLKLVP